MTDKSNENTSSTETKVLDSTEEEILERKRSAQKQESPLGEENILNSFLNANYFSHSTLAIDKIHETKMGSILMACIDEINNNLIKK